ncbi:signal peptidase I [Desulfurococcus amylolyticus]|uniref:signal peptidase I n=1 Tax=Desulfurococcus amylolyticus TaxID=94694 RepID=UPI0023F1B73B|nr:signal peptidase I [Desulfurococcus amylolyticus]
MNSLFSRNTYLISLLLYVSWIIFTALSKFTGLLYGFSYYLVPSSIAVVLVSVFSTLMPGTRGSMGLYYYIAFASIPISYIVVGLLTGFGINTLISSLPQYLASIFYYVSSVTLIESSRKIILTHAPATPNNILLYSTSVVQGLAYLFLLENVDASISVVAKSLYWVAWGILGTITYISNGFKASLCLSLIQVSMYKLSPVLPLRMNVFLAYLPLLVSTILAGLLLFMDRAGAIANNKMRGIRRHEPAYPSLILLVVALLLVFSFLQGYRLLVISSGSMTPSLGIGDIVVIEPKSIKSISVGDIVAFSNGVNIVVHRVVNVTSDGSCLITRGDANNVDDPLWACINTILGRVVFRVPYIGYPFIMAVGAIGSVYTVLFLASCLLCLTFIIYIVKNMLRYTYLGE